MTPKVTAIIPAYNAAGYVGQAVRSALDQRGVDVEVIVIDDGSTDDTPRVLEQFGTTIRTVRQANTGHVKARNRAAQLAAGEWLAFLDADDEWLPDKLARQLELADQHTGLIYTARVNIGDCGRVSEKQTDVDTLHEGDIFEPLLLGNFITVSSAMMRKDWYERLGGFHAEPYGSEDWDLWLRYAAEGGRVRCSKEALTCYRWHSASMSSNHDRMCSGRLKVLERAFALPRGRRLPWTTRSQAMANAWMVAAWCAAGTRRGHALLWYCRALAWWPFSARPYKGIAKSCLGRA
jgi:glycosyltransferase involved in cell wall biosynthesis